jgi:hypothetical protein
MEQYIEHRAVAAEALQAIAAEISDRAGLNKLQALFDVFDKDNSGGLSEDEFGQALAKYGAQISDKQLTKIFKVLDADGNGTISIEEFSAIAKCELEFLTLNQVAGNLGDDSGLDIQREANEKVTNALKNGVRLNRSSSVAMDPRMQGDVEMLTTVALMKREELKENTAVFEQVQAWWNQVVLKEDGKMTKEGYIVCNVGLQKQYVPDTTPEEMLQTAEQDWTTDCPTGQDRMGYMEFFNAMFELCKCLEPFNLYAPIVVDIMPNYTLHPHTKTNCRRPLDRRHSGRRLQAHATPVPSCTPRCRAEGACAAGGRKTALGGK